MAFTINDEEVYPVGYYTSTGERKQPTASDGNTVDLTIDLSGIVNPVVTYYRDTDKTNIENVINRPVGYVSAFEGHQDWLRPMADFVPFVGDALQAKDAAVDAVNGDYLNAGIGAGLLLLPNVIEKPLKYIGKGIKRLWKATDSKLDDIYRLSPEQWTPEQWTAAQDAAIARGDMAEAQRLRDLHSSLTDSATPGKYYRGTQTKRNSYLDRHVDEEVGEMNGIYLTKKPKYAKTYGDVEEFYLRSNNPLETEGSWTGVIDDATRAEIENAGYDAVVNNRFDTGFLNKLLRNSRDETITFNGKNLKLADAVTYDDNGIRIPLGERDNFNINDIRYGLLPFLGLGAAGTLYGKLK